MFVLELLVLVFAGRQVVQHDANPRSVALFYSGAFFLIDLMIGWTILPSIAARLACIPMAEIHFRSIRRFSGFLFFCAIAIGILIPYAAGEIRGLLSAGSAS